MNGELRKDWEDVADVAHIQSFELRRLDRFGFLQVLQIILKNIKKKDSVEYADDMRKLY